jgi:chromosome segregation ATPase
MLEKVLFYFDIIQSLFIKNKQYIDIQKYIVQQQNDDLDKIYELIKRIIEKELLNSYCTIKFNVELWSLYSNRKSLDTLKFIRKIINECEKIDPHIDEQYIQLPKKIHYAGFYEIQAGTLYGEKLLQFLGEDAFYMYDRVNQCIQVNVRMQNKVDAQEIQIRNLEERKRQLENDVSSLERENSSLKSEVNSLENEISRLEREIEEKEREKEERERRDDDD